MAFLEIYSNLIIFVTYISVMIFMLLIILKSKVIFKEVIKNWQVIFLLLVLAFSVNLLFENNYFMFGDQILYSSLADNIIQNGDFKSCSANIETNYCFIPLKPPLWPFILSLIFRIDGVTIDGPILISRLFMLLSVILIFFLGKKVFNKKTGILASLFLILSPTFHIWSASAESNLFSTFMVILSMLSFYIFKDKKKPYNLWLLFFSIILTILSRFENVILLFFFSSWLIKDDFLKQAYSFSILVFIFLSQFIIYPIFRELPFILSIIPLHLITILQESTLNWILFIPLILYFIKGYNKGKSLFSLGVLFLFFNGLNYNLTRMALTPQIFIILISSYMIIRFKRYLIIFFILILSLNFIFEYTSLYNEDNYYAHYLEKKTSEIKDLKLALDNINNSCNLFSIYPLSYSLYKEDINAYSLNKFKNKNDSICFYKDSFCDFSSLTHASCSAFIKIYNLSFKENYGNIILYTN